MLYLAFGPLGSCLMFSATCVFSLIVQPLTDEPNKKWPYYTPKLAFMLIYIMSIALGVAIGAILAWHLWLIMTGQTTVENHDASHYRGVAKKRGGATVSPLRIYSSTDFLL